jgi:hypothetical protein
MKQVFIGALLLKEEINLNWVFLGKPNLENDLSFHEKQKKCTCQLADYLDYQVQALSSKLGRIDPTKQNNVQAMVTTPISKDNTIVGQLCLCLLLTYLFYSE